MVKDALEKQEEKLLEVTCCTGSKFFVTTGEKRVFWAL